MQVLILRDYDELSREAARRVVAFVLREPRAVLGFPTGETPLGMYKALVRFHQEGLVDFSEVAVFNLDEYLGLSPTHPASFRRYMEAHFLDHVPVGTYHIPDSKTDDPEAECRRYEELIAEAGGLDLVVLGLGPNGHIAFNEPGTPFEVPTHVAELARETREREARRFGSVGEVPEKAITMGIRTIMNAREVILLAAGAEKAVTVRDALFGPITTQVPASVLQLHPRLTVILDRGAASALPVRGTVGKRSGR